MNILFHLFFPFFSFLLTLKNFSSASIKLPIYLFAFLFGYSIYFSGGDLVRYQEGYSEIIKFTFPDFIHNVFNSYNDEEKFIRTPSNVFNSKPDFYALTIGFLISRFTENPRWLFAIISLIYTIIQVKFFEEVLYDFRYRVKGFQLFFASLVLIVPFYVGATGVRFWPALFIFVWMIYKYTKTASKRYLIYATLSMLFHYTFLFPCILVLISSLVKIKKSVFKILILFGVLFSLVSSTTSSLKSITYVIESIGSESISNSTSSYTNEELVNNRNLTKSQANWYVRLRETLIIVFFYAFFLIDFFNLHKWKKPQANELFLNVYQFFFLTSIFTLGLASLGRFNYIFYLLCILRILQFQIPENQSRLFVFNRIFFVILIIHVLVSFRAGFYFLDPLLLISPSAALFFIHSDVSLSEWIVGH